MPQAFWLGTSTALTATVVQPGCATFADIIGRRGALTLSAAMLTLGGLLAAVAQNYATILTGRCLQGIGVGGVYTITEIIVAELVPLRLRSIWFGFLSVFTAIGTCGGPILSGVLTETASWVCECDGTEAQTAVFKVLTIL
jgi:MFS family permease